MSNKGKISLFEHNTLTTENPIFEKRHLLALEKFHSQSKIEYFSLVRNGVKFKHYVGVIQAGDLTIEVLPKPDAEQSNHDDSKETWRGVLLTMLRECKYLKVEHVDKANLKLKSNSILDVYLELFLSEVEWLIRNGLVKKYTKCEGNILALKGRLDFSKNIAKNLTHKERFYTHYTRYSFDNIFNNILLEAIRIIPKISSNPHFADRVNRLILNFPEIPGCKVSEATFAKLSYDRKTESYKEAMLISKMLLLNFRPDISGGTENVVAIMFNMNRLWEEFIYRRLKREEGAFGINVSKQQPSDFWKPVKEKSKTIRPDLVIKKPNTTIILDTKWKMLPEMIPSDSDLKQMFIYNLFWACDKSYLLYPANKSESGSGDYHCFNVPGNFKGQCGVEKILILENGMLKPTLGAEIIERIGITRNLSEPAILNQAYA